jgi:XPG I-region/XPG N-terminal domain
MGVKDFTKVFESNGEFHYKDFKDKNVVIDASVEIYRAALGMKMSETLTDAFGNPTAHINIILLGIILKLKANKANQYWVFDYYEGSTNHNPLKLLELQKRKAKRENAKEKIVKLKQTDELFSDDEDIKQNIDKQEKAAFSMKQFYIDDVKFMLDMLDIPWIDCLPGFDAEQIAAISTNINIFDKKMDCVLSPDADCLPFGCKQLIKRDIRKKKLFKYNLDDLLIKHELTQDDLIKISLILGTDFAPKTPGVGPKTVLKKYKSIELSTDQINAMKYNFKRVLTDLEISQLKKPISEPFTNEKKYKDLLDWLHLVKNFNRERIEKQFNKLNLFDKN